MKRIESAAAVPKSVTKVADDPLADDRLVEAGLDQHGVDDGEARRRERDPGDLGGISGPAQHPIGERHHDQEGRREGDASEQKRRLPLALELRHVDLGAGEEREHDPGEGADEGEPIRNPGVEGVADDDAERELDQRDRDPELDRDRRRGQDRRRQKHCNCEFAHLYLLRKTLRLG
jgi:hypothetical protein